MLRKRRGRGPPLGRVAAILLDRDPTMVKPPVGERRAVCLMEVDGKYVLMVMGRRKENNGCEKNRKFSSTARWVATIHSLLLFRRSPKPPLIPTEGMMKSWCSV